MTGLFTGTLFDDDALGAFDASIPGGVIGGSGGGGTSWAPQISTKIGMPAGQLQQPGTGPLPPGTPAQDWSGLTPPDPNAAPPPSFFEQKVTFGLAWPGIPMWALLGGGAVVVGVGGYFAWKKMKKNGRRSKARKNALTQTAWTVTLHGKNIDTVFYGPTATAEEVRKSLIDHDGYDPSIRVSKQRRSKGTKKSKAAPELLMKRFRVNKRGTKRRTM